ncbi:MAG: FIG005080: Possible exported protein [uncultured Caballeronia sp.]|nr:MAG: FIG005080: Possible exported protein [uncultured Caballeronia sp.]
MSDRKELADPPEAVLVKLGGRAELVFSRVLKVLLVLVAVVYFAVAGIYLALRYAVLPQLDAFRPRIEQMISSKIHAQLHIGRITAKWSGFEPSFDIDNLRIDAADGTPGLAVPHASATVAWRSLLGPIPLLSNLTVDGPDVVISRAADGTFSVAGVPIQAKNTGNDAFMTWLLRQQAIVLRDGTLRWHDGERNAPELALKRIKLAILNNGRHHRLALQALPDGDLLHGLLDFRADFRTPRFSVPGRPANWTGQAYLSTGPVDLPKLSQYVTMPFATYGGRFDNRIWIDFASGKLKTAGGELTGSDIALRVRPTQPRLDAPITNFNWNLGLQDDEYTLHLVNLRAELGQPPLADGTPVSRLLALHTLTGHYRAASLQHGQMFGVAGDVVDLGILGEFLRALPLPSKLQNNLIRLNPRGQIANYTLQTERPKLATHAQMLAQRQTGAEPPMRYTVKGDLHGVSVQAQEPPPGLTINNHPRAGIPGVENLWGSIDADQDHGSAVIDTKNTAITVPGVFDNPRLVLDQIDGRVTWTLADAPGKLHKAIIAHVKTLHVRNADAEASATADYRNEGEGRGYLDLKAKAARLNATSLVHYLPTSINEKVRLYLGHALQTGISRNATIEIHGDLTKFPYSRFPEAGQFRIVAPFFGGKFEPTPCPPKTMANGTPNVWSAFDGIDGTFHLAENKLGFDISRGRYLGVSVVKTTGRIEDLGNRESKLLIDADAHGPITDMLHYVENSSLGSLSHHVATKIHATGNAALALQLEIPRVAPPPGMRAHVGYKGALTFNGNDLAYGTFPPLSNLKGRARFGEKTASLDGLTAKFLGGDVRGTGGVKPDGSYAFDVNGRIGADAAQSLNAHDQAQAAQILKHISGTAPYDLRVRGEKNTLPQIEANSDLTGLGLDFPAPFNKSEGTPIPFAFTFKPITESTEEHDARFMLGPVNARYLLKQTGKEAPTVKRGAIGVNKLADLPAQGVSAAVDIDELDADAWRKLITELGPMPQPDPKTQSQVVKQFLPSRFALHFATIKLLDRRWEDVTIGANLGDDRKWQANIASDQVTGNAQWLPGATKGSPGALQARFTKVVIPGKEETDLVGQMIRKPPANMPSIDLIVNELVVRWRTLGRLEVDAHNDVEDNVPVWHLDKLELSNPDAKLSATANWHTISGPVGFPADADDNAPRRTALDFKLDIMDAGALVERLGLPRTVKGGKGTVTGQLGWDGSPVAVDLRTLNGKLNADLQHGQILKVNPGAAKLLGVLSLQSLAHFLTLNFQDVVGKGLPFEKITGSGTVQNGIDRTNDFTMITAPAHVELKGLVDLPKKTQDLHAKVIPTISASAVALGAAVINPLLGPGTLVADLLLSKSISKAFTIDYSITGPWSKPVIQRVKGDQGKIEIPATTVPN